MKPHRAPRLIAAGFDLVTQPAHQDSRISFSQQLCAVRNDGKVTGGLAMGDGPLHWPVETEPGLEKLACLSGSHGIEHGADRFVARRRRIAVIVEIGLRDEGSAAVFELHE